MVLLLLGAHCGQCLMQMCEIVGGKCSQPGDCCPELDCREGECQRVGPKPSREENKERLRPFYASRHKDEAELDGVLEKTLDNWVNREELLWHVLDQVKNGGYGDSTRPPEFATQTMYPLPEASAPFANGARVSHQTGPGSMARGSRPGQTVPPTSNHLKGLNERYPELQFHNSNPDTDPRWVPRKEEL